MASRLGPALGPRWEARDRLYAALAAAGALVAFAPALNAGFVWDDAANLVQNPGFRSLDWRHLKWMFTTTYMGPYQPLSWLSLALDFKLWGMRPFGFHLTNLLLHAANAALFFAVSRALLSRALPQAPAHRLRLGALAAALFFGAHPLRAESVAWLTERRDVLSGFFLLAATAAYLRRRLAWAFALFLAGLLAKATGAVLPAAWLILDWRILGRLESRRSFNRALLEKLPFFGLALAFSVLAVLGQWTAGNLVALGTLGGTARAAQAVLGLAFYVQKTVCPIALSPLYARAGGLELLGAATSLSAAFVIVCVLVLRFLGLSWKSQAALWGYYVLALLPVLGFLQNGPQLFADRYSYISCLGWAFLAGAGVATASGPWPVLAPALVAAAAAALGLGSWRRAAAWTDDVSLWSAAAQVEPVSAAVLDNYSLALAAAHRLPDALAQIERACALEPGNAAAWADKSYVLLELKRLPEAEEAGRKAEALDADYAPALTYLGVALFEQGRAEEAVPHFRRAVELKPGWGPAHDNLESALLASRAGKDGKGKRK